MAAVTKKSRTSSSWLLLEIEIERARVESSR